MPVVVHHLLPLVEAEYGAPRAPSPGFATPTEILDRAHSHMLFDAYKQHHLEHGLPFDDEHLRKAMYDVNSGNVFHMDAMHRLLAEHGQVAVPQRFGFNLILHHYRGFWKWCAGNSAAYATWLGQLPNAPTAVISADEHLNCWEAINYLLYQTRRLSLGSLQYGYGFEDKQAGAVEMYTHAAGQGRHFVHKEWPDDSWLALGNVVGLGLGTDPLHHVVLVVESLAGKPVRVAHVWSANSTGGHLDVCTLDSLHSPVIDKIQVWRLP